MRKLLKHEVVKKNLNDIKINNFKIIIIIITSTTLVPTEEPKLRLKKNNGIKWREKLCETEVWKGNEITWGNAACSIFEKRKNRKKRKNE